MRALRTSVVIANRDPTSHLPEPEMSFAILGPPAPSNKPKSPEREEIVGSHPLDRRDPKCPTTSPQQSNCGAARGGLMCTISGTLLNVRREKTNTGSFL
jgi:hypothetical protein